MIKTTITEESDPFSSFGMASDIALRDSITQMTDMVQVTNKMQMTDTTQMASRVQLTDMDQATDMIQMTDTAQAASMTETTDMVQMTNTAMTQEEMLAEINRILNDRKDKKQVDGIIPLLHGKWELQIMLEVCRADVLRFGEFRRRIPGITNSVLTAALRNLERWGLISRTQFNEIPPRVEYAPTEKGMSLLPVCYEIIRWGAENSLDDSAEL